MDSRYQLHHGDCLEVLKTLPDCSVDAVVTDPPYGLSFMGKRWDYDVPAVEVWQECLRVLKPGGHLLAFAGTRTQHRMAVRIEDAGFEIRDLIAWVYSQGFPKGHDIAWEMHKKACVACGLMVEYDHENKSTAEKRGADTICEHGLRFVRASYLQTPVYACSECGQVLQPFLSEQDASDLRAAWSKSKTVWPKQPCMERRGDLEKTKGELQRCQVCKMSSGFFADGAKGWIHNGASPCNGEIPWQVAEPNGSRPSYRPQSIEQLDRQPDAFRIERRAQEIRGFNTALKPAFEPVTMARKPFASTVAANVLEHGTGGLNVDGCRVGTEVRIASFTSLAPCHGNKLGQAGTAEARRGTQGEPVEYTGRWPANFIHDGSEEVLALFPETASGMIKSYHHQGGKTRGIYGAMDGIETDRGYGDQGSAARFFYTAKASKADRDAGVAGVAGVGALRDNGRESMPRKNHHPTVKPTDLMRYLCRLVTPPGGIVLDPFTGSGSTGKAAILEGFRFIGIEREAEYIEIARARIQREAEKPRQPTLFD